jgi:hypothetical protein
LKKRKISGLPKHGLNFFIFYDTHCKNLLRQQKFEKMEGFRSSPSGYARTILLPPQTRQPINQKKFVGVGGKQAGRRGREIFVGFVGNVKQRDFGQRINYLVRLA